MSGLPRQDVPPRLLNALEPGQLRPSCRRQRSVIGKTNRSTFQTDLRADALSVILKNPNTQQRALSSLGMRRAGTPSLANTSMLPVTDVSAISGFSNTTAAEVQTLVARSLTPMLKYDRYQDEVVESHARSFSPSLHHGPVVSEERSRRSVADEDIQKSVILAAASAPRRPTAALPESLRASLLCSPEPITISAATTSHVQDLRRSQSAALDSSVKAINAMQRFLRTTSADAAGKTGGVDPLQQSYIVHPKFRQELTDYHPTERITATQDGCGMWAAADERFDASTRGVVGHSHVAAAGREAESQRRNAVLDRIRQRTTRFDTMAEEAAQRAEERDRANIAKCAMLKKQSADLAHASSERERRFLGKVPSPAVPTFLPRF